MYLSVFSTLSSASALLLGLFCLQFIGPYYGFTAAYSLNDVSDFVAFTKDINNGTNFMGETVYLDADVDFTGVTFGPIGNSSRYFRGTFDGQGHRITGLAIASSSQYTGFFGYSEGMFIRNLVLDPSCSISSSYSAYNAYLGGLIGYSSSYYSDCVIENCVNLASITFTGVTSSYKSYIGGLVGHFFSSQYSTKAAVMKNCANYGTVQHAGQSTYTYIGGLSGSSETRVYVQNCLNDGEVVHEGATVNTLYIGGISGYSYECSFENCVNSGNVSTNDNSGYAGSIVGSPRYSPMSHCYATTAVKYGIWGYAYTYTTTPVFDNVKFDDTFKLAANVSIGGYTGDSLIEALNTYSTYYELRDYSRWALNRNENAVSFMLNGANLLTVNSRVVLLPAVLIEDGTDWFDGWYTDSAYTTSLDGSEIDPTVTGLYSRIKENTDTFTISFDTGAKAPIAAVTDQYHSIVALPNSSARDDCSIAFWAAEYGDEVPWNFTIPAQDITLYAVWTCAYIASVGDFADFAKSVNFGVSYKGSTVALSADLDFNGVEYEVVGMDADDCFRGTFDGQGHTVSNLNIASSLSYVGMFGVSVGMTVRNVVADGSCSAASLSTSSKTVHLGMIVGHCTSGYGDCTVENTVNMGSVTFGGSISSDLYLGGIAGDFVSSSSSGYNIYAKSCANYGPVSHVGRSSGSHIGGIVGELEENTHENSVQNCLSYGEITCNAGETGSLYIGGITGEGKSIVLENCVSYGKIVTSKTSSYVGAIIGKPSESVISNCYWSEGVGYDGYGYKASSTLSEMAKFDAGFVLNQTTTFGDYAGTGLLDVLNAYVDHYSLRDHFYWVLNRGGSSVTFKVNDWKGFALDAKILLLPNLVSEGGKLWFDGWYTDSACTAKFTEKEMTGDTALYGKYGTSDRKYTITFDTRDGTPVPEPITAQFGTVVALPTTPKRNKCTVGVWVNEYEDEVLWDFTVPARDITLYAIWKCAHITDATDLVYFSKTINMGVRYDETVYLDNDIVFTEELSKEFEPIGKGEYNYFGGSFDGQGHTISNLVIHTNSSYNGLFGHSKGMTIQNVVVDDTCSFTNSFVSEYISVSIGGIIGFANTRNSGAHIYNCVNMANITFYGRAGYNFFAGGIAGYFGFGYIASNLLTNCANFGRIANYGMSESYTEMGGIAGIVAGSYLSSLSVTNCASYGSIYHNWTTGERYIGGIVGYSSSGSFSNCVSGGVITTNQDGAIGRFIGYAGSSVTLTHCFWTSEGGRTEAYGDNSSAVTVSNSTLATLGPETLERLNWFASGRWSTYNTWNAMYLNGGRIRGARQAMLAIQHRHFPDPDAIGYTFYGWFKDADFTEAYDPRTASKTVDVYAKCIPNNYTVTLDLNGGSWVEAREVVVTFDRAYGVLPEPVLEGFFLSGWATDTGEIVTSESIVEIPRDHTLRAEWEKVSDRVEIVFGTKDITKKEAEKIVKEFTSADFRITKFEPKDEETVVIVKFTDPTDAVEFVRTVRSYSKGSMAYTMRVGFSTSSQGEDGAPYCHLSSSLFYLLQIITM